MVGKMAKPEEVLVVETPEGEVVRETMKDTDAIEQYKVMQTTLGWPRHSVWAHIKPHAYHAWAR
jgi:exportin-1